MPVISPVLESMIKPSGNPVAEKDRALLASSDRGSANATESPTQFVCGPGLYRVTVAAETYQLNAWPRSRH